MLYHHHAMFCSAGSIRAEPSIVPRRSLSLWGLGAAAGLLSFPRQAWSGETAPVVVPVAAPVAASGDVVLTGELCPEPSGPVGAPPPASCEPALEPDGARVAAGEADASAAALPAESIPSVVSPEPGVLSAFPETPREQLFAVLGEDARPLVSVSALSDISDLSEGLILSQTQATSKPLESEVPDITAAGGSSSAGLWLGGGALAVGAVLASSGGDEEEEGGGGPPANNAPASTGAALATLTVLEGGAAQSFTLSSWFADPDAGDTLTFSLRAGTPSWATLDSAMLVLALAFDQTDDTDVGRHTLVVTASDSTALTASHTVTLAVTNVAESPTTTRSASAMLTAREGAAVRWDVSGWFSDPDLAAPSNIDSLTYTGRGLPDWLILRTATGSLTIAARATDDTDVGQHTFTLTATDETGRRATHTTTLTVVDEMASPTPTPTPTPTPRFVRNVLDTSTLAPTRGFIIQGDEVGDELGWSVAGVGDINGDGVDDLIVGALAGDDGGDKAGEIYFIYGKTGTDGTQFGTLDEGRQVLDTTHMRPAVGLVLQGDAPDDALGSSVSGAGDINGDGVNDLIVGAWLGDDGGDDAGEAYVIYGKAGTQFGSPVEIRQVLDLTNLAPTDGFIIQGDAGGDTFDDDRLGRSVAGAGDINGDGLADLIVGSYQGDDGGTDAGEAYIIYGKAGTNGTQFGTLDEGRQVLDTTDLAATDGFIIQGDAADDQLGISVAGAGDINSDGLADLIVGAWEGGDGGFGAGEAYIIYGKAGTGSQFGTTIRGRQVLDTTHLASNEGFILRGDRSGDALGWSVAGAGDINGDEFDDLVVGAWLGDDGGTNAGEAYIVYGKAGTQFGTLVGSRQVLDTTSLAPADGFIIQGDRSGDRLGSSVSGAGDINGDGYDDLIVGAVHGDDGGEMAGEAYIIYGKAGTAGTQFGTLVGSRQVLDTTSLASTDGFIIRGDEESDDLGWAVAGAGDINGDGYDDLIVGAPRGDDGGDSDDGGAGDEGDEGGDNAGEAYIIYGGAHLGGVSTRAEESLTGVADELFFFG